MRDKTNSSFSYTMRILKFSQVFMSIGILVGVFSIANNSAGIVSSVLFALLLIGSIIFEKKLQNTLKERIIKEAEELSTLKNTMFSNVQIPVAVIEYSGSIKWANKAFLTMCEVNELVGKNIKNIVQDIKPNEFTIAQSTYEKAIKIKTKEYNMLVEAFTKVEDKQSHMFVLYFIDHTETNLLKKMIRDQRCMLGYVCIDSFEEIMHSIEEVRRPMLMAIIDRKINLWFKEREVVVTKFERDKYLMVFNRKELENMQERKFDILDELRHIQVGNELPVTISIGIGYNLSSLNASREDARAAFDLAQGRGGDQAVIKNSDKYTFYGGKTKEVEKSTRVKVRIKAYAFKELLHEADKVYIMGHKGIDMDCLGAAMGVYRAAAIMGKKAHIILDEPTFAIQALYNRILESNEYEDLFISHDIAQDEIKKDTLLVIVDVHRTSYLEAPEILEVAEKVVIFDHHRKSTDFIEDAVLTYLEPFISSTCEMIAEILNYLTDKIKLTQIEADALLAGITIDTKNFVFKAGVRTFEAAAFLRRNGADSSRVRMLFQNDMDFYKARAAAIKDAEMWHPNIAVSEVDGKIPHAPIVAAQVADELLNIKGIEASFVITSKDDYVMISARSLYDVNVQRVMELLGGGGHLSVAGAQLKDITPLEAKVKLKEAMNKYFEEGESK
ncbi:DHH family phosphoesterase [Cellulosilyticum sp. I15G10I2]|uniref:DHH family phosphoesterase n=1 Tax=Cellulosilyticum sp. I15G10I2 TaxID=1892843 RepID=UPI00085C7651|nr:DHH family phosphoesterase [Cellulosilyticum sp. I15G10I2]